CRECSGSGPHLSRLAVLASFRLKEIFPGDFDDVNYSGLKAGACGEEPQELVLSLQAATRQC
ncbi:MAG: hypothetical protein PWQ39_1686, partial [Thermacetogenium sp.]|nr:hypothetical protein [Thermacetogenium sp.]